MSKTSDKPRVLTKSELRTIMPRLTGWALDKNKLRREFEFQDFVESLSFVNSLVAYFETMFLPGIFFNFLIASAASPFMISAAGHLPQGA